MASNNQDEDSIENLEARLHKLKGVEKLTPAQHEQFMVDAEARLNKLLGREKLSPEQEKIFIDNLQQRLDNLTNNQVNSFEALNSETNTRKQTFTTDNMQAKTLIDEQVDRLTLRKKELSSDFTKFHADREARLIKEIKNFGITSREVQLMTIRNRALDRLETKILNNVTNYAHDSDIRMAKGVIQTEYTDALKAHNQKALRATVAAAPKPQPTAREALAEQAKKQQEKHNEIRKTVNELKDSVVETAKQVEQLSAPAKNNLPTPKPAAIIKKDKEDVPSFTALVWQATKTVTQIAWTGIKGAYRLFTGTFFVESTISMVEKGAKIIESGAESLIGSKESKTATPTETSKDSAAYDQSKAAQAEVAATIPKHQQTSSSFKSFLSAASPTVTAAPEQTATATHQPPKLGK
jgi:flagellar hook-basal body complex protein FliE